MQEASEALGFNPTLVRLRPWGTASISSRDFCFNPTLVRLRPGQGLCGGPAGGVFQSHAGSIEAARLRKLIVERIFVSIPRWFD